MAKIELVAADDADTVSGQKLSGGPGSRLVAGANKSEHAPVAQADRAAGRCDEPARRGATVGGNIRRSCGGIDLTKGGGK